MFPFVFRVRCCFVFCCFVFSRSHIVSWFVAAVRAVAALTPLVVAADVAADA
jgi:hypothetical protein